ncbi:MAG: histidine kinase [Bacteroidetes bacterium]|nr:histidine kinase [Bacteroidota bacterium]
MIKVSKYILFQAFGWGAFALFNIYVAYILQELTLKIFIFNLLFSGLGFLLSHLYRNFLRTHKWIYFKTEKLIQYVMLVTILLSALYNMCYYLLKIIIDIKTQEEYLGNFISAYVLFSLWNLFYFTWQYIEKNKRIQIETLKMESSLKDLEIKTIRSNLQPHFIFNSLNSIRALIDENPELARDAITKISNILRNTITSQEATDTLEKEVALVEDYLALEKIRFEERIHFIKNIDPLTLQLQVPTMMLQTLIENAVKHGISNLQQGGNILLNVTLRNDQYLAIDIINDTGVVKKTSNEFSLGFGLSSSKQRLKLLYNDKAKLSLHFENNKAIVNIIIPLTSSYKPLKTSVYD